MNQLLASLVVMTAACAASAGGLPNLAEIHPHGLERGTERTLTFQGANLQDPQEVFFYEAGMTVTKIEAVKPEEVKVTLKAAPDCPLGEHRARLRTLAGWTPLRTFFVGPYPEVEEKAPNGDFAAPQKVALNVTVEGTITSEDVDYYAVEAKKGQRLSAEVEGIRLGIGLFDPYVAILDHNRFELAAADDTALLNQDAYASVIVPEDGTYVVMIRESAYGGGDKSHYRLHIGQFPRPLAAIPCGGQVGQQLKFKFVGDKTGPIDAEVTLGAEPRDLMPVFAQHEGQVSPSPNWVRVSAFPGLDEIEPNNDRDHATGTEAEAPIGFNGVIATKGDEDWFRFKARKGQALDVHVYARSLRTPLDSVVEVFMPNGTHVGGNDDSGEKPDSYFRFTAPEDGSYYVMVRDHLRAGGDAYGYRLEVTPITPRVRLRIPEVARNDTQSRQWIAVPKGNRSAALFQADRADFGGAMKFIADNLPPGVTMNAPVMPESVNQVMIVFEAAPDASPSGKLADLRVSHIDEKTGIAGRFASMVELVQGEPNNTAYYTTQVDRLPVAVTQEVPFRIAIVQPKAPIVQAGVMGLKIVAERLGGFKAAINVQLPFRPPGIGATDTVTIPEGQNEVVYSLNAAGNAGLGDWPIAVIGWSEVGGIDRYVSSPLATLKIAPPILNGEIAMAATQQDQAVDVVVKLTHPTPFDGEATLELVGLPPQCTTQPVKINKDSAEAVFKVKTGSDTPTGQHKSLFCQVTVTRDGEPIIQSLAGGGTLRVDKPRPAITAAAPPAPPPPTSAAAPAPPPAPEKRLSRLDQLRLEAEQKAKTVTAQQ